MTHGLWEALGKNIQNFLASVTLADIVAARVPGQEDSEHCPAHKRFADIGVSPPAE
jgi:DNA-binding IscR family transcriptional regulator